MSVAEKNDMRGYQRMLTLLFIKIGPCRRGRDAGIARLPREVKSDRDLRGRLRMSSGEYDAMTSDSHGGKNVCSHRQNTKSRFWTARHAAGRL